MIERRWMIAASAALVAAACGGGGGPTSSTTAAGSTGSTGAGGETTTATGTGAATGTGTGTSTGTSTGAGGAGPAAPRWIAPSSTSTVLSQTPMLRWELAPGTDGAHVDVCSDRACTKITQTFDAPGTSAKLPAPLSRGVWFLRLFGRAGSTTGATPSAVWEIIAGARSALIDATSGTLLDPDGDGLADLAIAAPQLTMAAGAVYFFRGAKTGLPASPTATIPAPNGAGSLFGTSLASAGDADGDGFPELAVGAPGYPAKTGNGRVYVFPGGPAGLAAAPGTTLESPAGQGEAFGTSVASAGDVDGDGYADLLVGAPASAKAAGRAYLFLGGPNGFSPMPTATLKGADLPDEAFGVAVAGAGDVNGDGFADVVIGAYADLPNAPSGKAFIFLGSANGLSTMPVATLASPSPAPDDAFGLTIAPPADVNGDGYADVVIGAPRVLAGAGRVHVFTGGMGGVAAKPAFTLQGSPGELGLFGWSISAAGDVDRDGYADIVVGEPDTFAQQGRVHVFEGSGTGPGAFADVFVDAFSKTAGRFGTAAAILGDADGDGYDDTAAGAPGIASGSGEAYAFPGGPNGPISLPKPTFKAPAVGGFFGDAIAR